MDRNPRSAATIWLTGIPRSGKSTLAFALERHLREAGVECAVLDGDDLRRHLWPELGFSRQDRDLNVSRIGHLAALLAGHGIVPIVAAVSPYRDARENVRMRLGRFVEIYCRCPVEVASARDFKGLYDRARRGEGAPVTGAGAAYEEPPDPQVVVSTDVESVEESMNRILASLERCLGMALHDAEGAVIKAEGSNFRETGNGAIGIRP
jgi:adenylyl-sulfate kinase